jgi:hypothetical protein
MRVQSVSGDTTSSVEVIADKDPDDERFAPGLVQTYAAAVFGLAGDGRALVYGFR